MKTIQCKAYDELVTLENCEPVPDLAACRTCKSPKNTLQSKKPDMKKLSKGQLSKEPLSKEPPIKAEPGNEDENKPIYRLWWEYLRRSDNYRAYWREYRREGPTCRVPTKYRPVKGEPVNPLIRVSRSWGDVFAFDFEHCWKYKKKQLRKSEFYSEAVREYSERVGNHLSACISAFYEMKGRQPSLDEFTDYFPQYMEENLMGWLYLVVSVEGSTTEELAEQFKKLVIERKKDPRVIKQEEYLRLNKKPSWNSRVWLEKLERYLKVYDLRKRNDMKWEDVLKKIEPGKKFNEKTRRAIRNDFDNAERIIKNVEKGEFPGDY